MAGQIVNISWEETISEVSLKCGDPFFQDFPKNIYSQAVYRAQRSIAKQYKVMDRIWAWLNTEGESRIEVLPLNYNGVIRLTVTRDGDTTPITYEQKQVDEVQANTDDSIYYFSIVYDTNKYMLEYTNPTANDTLTLYYVASISEEDYEPYDSNGNQQDIPVLPNKYTEETIRRAVLWMAQLGLAKFFSQKKQKYYTIYQMYVKPEDRKEERGLERDRPPIKLTLFSTKYP